MNIHVVGDSFATLDKTCSHWATIWSNKHGFNVSHHGHPGRDHVFIVSDYMDNNYIENADLVIYHVTCFLRVQAQLPVFTYSQTLDALLRYTAKESGYPTLIDMSSSYTDKDSMFTIQPNTTIINDKCSRDRLAATQLYGTLSLSWLVQATTIVMNNLFLECKLRNIPFVVVPDRTLSDPKGEQRLFSKYDYVFTCPDDELLTIDHVSINHYGTKAHQRFAEWFDIFVQENRLV
jgi:hypothetical protein